MPCGSHRRVRRRRRPSSASRHSFAELTYLPIADLVGCNFAALFELGETTLAEATLREEAAPFDRKDATLRAEAASAPPTQTNRKNPFKDNRDDKGNGNVNSNTMIVGDPLDAAALRYSGWKYNRNDDCYELGIMNKVTDGVKNSKKASSMFQPPQKRFSTKLVPSRLLPSIRHEATKNVPL